MNGNRQPTTDDHAQLSVTVSIREIYNAVCPTCQQALLDLISGKAGAAQLREGLRRQLEAK
ncbi:hypothetical protein ES703_20690 [subsurface metagenome]